MAVRPKVDVAEAEIATEFHEVKYYKAIRGCWGTPDEDVK